MSYSTLYIFFGLFVFLGMGVIYFWQNRIYKKYDAESFAVFYSLYRKGFIDRDELMYYFQPGSLFFMHRAQFIIMLVKRKKIKRTKRRWMAPEASQYILSLYELSWVKTYRYLIWALLFFFLLLGILYLIAKLHPNQ